MKFAADSMTEDAAAEVLNWHYPYPYDFYNNEATGESIAEMLDGSYRKIQDEKEGIVGFYCTGKSAQVPAGRIVDAYPNGFIDFGLGMQPALTGQGRGNDFFAYIHQELHQIHPKKRLRLTVATFNRRAIRLYENFGFTKEMEFKSEFAEFQTMVEREK